MTKYKITVTERASYHHMPDGADEPRLEGLSIKAALSALRNVDFGNIGGMGLTELSDGTYLTVTLEDADDGSSQRMSSQRARRVDVSGGGFRIIRTYKLS